MEQQQVTVVERDLGAVDIVLSASAALVIWTQEVLEIVSSNVAVENRRAAILDLVRATTLLMGRKRPVVTALQIDEAAMHDQTSPCESLQVQLAFATAQHSYSRCTFLAVASGPIAAWLLPLSMSVTAAGVAASLAVQLVVVPSLHQASSFLLEVRPGRDCCHIVVTANGRAIEVLPLPAGSGSLCTTHNCLI